MTTIDTAVAFALRSDDGSTQTLWLGFEHYDEWAEDLARAIDESLSGGEITRASMTAEILNFLFGEFDLVDSAYGISFAKPDGIAHTIHTINYNDERVVLSDASTDKQKVSFTFREFVDRYNA